VSLAIDIIMLNIFLAIFNLMPIPPLDGSKILPKFLPYRLAIGYDRLRQVFERNLVISFATIIFIFVFVLATPIYIFTKTVTYLLIGY